MKITVSEAQAKAKAKNNIRGIVKRTRAATKDKTNANT